MGVRIKRQHRIYVPDPGIEEPIRVPAPLEPVQTPAPEREPAEQPA